MTRNERRLLTLFVSALLVGAAVVAADFYTDRRELLRAERYQLETEWVEIDALLEDRTIWNTRATWIDVNQPGFESTEQIDQAIYDTALAPTRVDVETDNHSLLDTEGTPFYTQAGVRFVARGQLADVFAWLHELKQSERFHAVRNLQISPDQDEEGAVVCQLELLRWYTPPSPEP